MLNPISRQNFADALAENHNLKLEVCHRYGEKSKLEVIMDVVVVNKVLEEDNKVVEEVNKKLVKEYNDFFFIFKR